MNQFTNIQDKNLQLKKIISLVCGVESSKINNDTLLAALGVDSLRRLSIITLIEEEFLRRIPEDAITKNTSIKDLSGLIDKSAKVPSINSNPGWQFTKPAAFLREIAFSLIMPLFRRFVKIKLIGSENLKANSEVIFMSNHPGIFDLFYLMDILRKNKIRFFVIADSDYWEGFRKIFIAPVLELFGAIPINKSGENNNRTMMQIGKLMNMGYSLLIVPQGTPTYQDPERIKEIKNGLVNITDLADYRIVPVIIDPHYNDIFDPRRESFTKFINGENILPRNIKNKEVKIIIGQPFYLDASKSIDEKKTLLVRKFTDLLSLCRDNS